MRHLLWLCVLLLSCRPVVSGTGPQAGFEQSHLVVLATVDSLEPEKILAPSVQFGTQSTWWNVLLTVEAVAKGNPAQARYVDYGTLPVWMSPPRPFKLRPNQIVIQITSTWQTADLVVGQRRVLFLRKCFYCIELPGRVPHPHTASPWFAILSLPAERWSEVAP